MAERADKQLVLVTGAGRGIGRAVAQVLAEGGARVAVNDIDAGAARQTVAEIREQGGRAEPFPADVGDPAAVRTMVAAAAAWGELSGLVNNAGIGGTGKTLIELSLDEWREMMRVNLDSVFLSCREVLPYLAAAGRGSIVNISSVSALMGVAGSTHYTAAKGGVIAFTKSLAREVAAQGVRVNAVAPGLVDTEMSRARGIDHQSHLVLLDRIGCPRDVGHAVSFLMSEEAGFITGQVLSPNGGAYM